MNAFLGDKVEVNLKFATSSKLAILCSCFVFVVLLAFQPFHINEHPVSIRLLLIVLFSLFAYLVCLLYYYVLNLIINKYFKLRCWKNKHELLFLIGTIVTTAYAIYTVVCFLANTVLADKIRIPKGFLLESFYFSAVMLVLVYVFLKATGYMMYFKNKANVSSNKYSKVNDTANSFSMAPISVIKISGANKTDGVFIYKVESILFIESNNKELIIHSLEDNGQIKRTMFRQTLSKLEEQFDKLKPNPFYRCHKSFIINTQNLIRVKGNSRQATAILRKQIIVPIARTKYAGLIEWLS